MNSPENRDVVDIEEAAAELEVYSPGEIERLDKHKGIKFKWFKETIVLIIATVIISAVLIVAGIQVFSADPDASGWAKQILTALMGFAAGALFSSTASRNE